MKIYSRELARDPTQTGGLRNSYEREILALIKELKPYWTKLVEAARDMLLGSRAEDFGFLVHNLFRERFLDPSKPLIQSHVLKTYLSGQAKAKANLKSIGIGAQVGTLPPNPRVLQILNARNFGALKGISDEMAKRIKESLTHSVLTGQGAEETAKALRASVGVGLKRARVIARTETLYAFNVAQVEEYKRYGIERVEWLTAEDERTCPKCAPLDGKEYDIDKHPDCPLHPNCRCTLLAVPEEV